MYVVAGSMQSHLIEEIWLDGEMVSSAQKVGPYHVTEANEEAGWIIRYATDEEVEQLVTKPGLVWPKDYDVLLQVRGKVKIVVREP